MVTAHDRCHGGFDGVERVASWKVRHGDQLIQPFSDDFDDMVCVDVGVHQICVRREEEDPWREARNFLQPFQEDGGIIYVRREEHRQHPEVVVELLAPAVDSRSTARADGTERQRAFIKMPVVDRVDLGAGAVLRQSRTPN